MNFANVMAREGSVKKTENGARAYDTAGQGAMLDLFSQIGALRSRDENEIRNKFMRAFREDALLATKMLFYAGDIREGGLGERRTFRICLRWLAENRPDIVNKNMELIPYYNRFDSWFVLCGTGCEKRMWQVVAKTLAKDVAAMKQSRNDKWVPISLLAKWMPSENATSKETVKLAERAIKHLGMRPRQYRRTLSALRKHINIVERQMSEGRWGEIDYSQVPSYAMHNYSSAFARHDYERFNAYLQSVNKGTAKINAGVLFPYDLVGKYLSGSAWNGRVIKEKNEVVEAQWKALPNYITKPMNAVVMADVSGSMWSAGGRPMQTSVGLAIYFAQHNKGAYHNKYMTFTTSPSFVNLREGASLLDCVKQVVNTGIGYSTNLEAAFKYILAEAVAYKVPKDEMPKALIVISDMEIDKYMRANARWDFIETMKRKFKAAGYELPKIILWNVEARNDTFLSQSEDVLFISGQSASSFKELCNNLNGVTAYEMMLKVLNGPAYARVVI